MCVCEREREEITAISFLFSFSVGNCCAFIVMAPHKIGETSLTAQPSYSTPT